MSEIAERRPTIVSLLGAPDRPTDGVADHAEALSAAIRNRGHGASVVRCRWDREGWLRALRALRGRLGEADRVLLHHTHLGWSRRGFPIGVLAAAAIIGPRRLWVLLHDPTPFQGDGFARRSRTLLQVSVMWILSRLADRTYATVAPACIPWATGRAGRRIALLPVGSNVGERAGVRKSDGSQRFTVVVFSITENARDEARLVARAVTKAGEKLGAGVRLVAFGRGVDGAREWLEHDVGPGVEVVTSGVLPAAEAAGYLSEGDALLFVRGAASSRRGTLVAGMAFGLPIVAFEGEETCWPITEAGIELVPQGGGEGIVGALVRIASDPEWASQLRSRSESAYFRYFSWDGIARVFLDGGLTR
jgi:glycosyltransferase involved in cell wall biosynthesis